MTIPEIATIAKSVIADLGKCEHEWMDIRNSVVQSGSWCPKCHKLRAENFDQP